jgi:hypothetical protein
MRRLFFVAVALLAVGLGAWLRAQGTASSFGPYTGAQLDTLEAGYRAAMQAPPAPGVGPRVLAAQEASVDAEVSLGLLHAERQRRRALLGVLAVAILATLGALLPRRGGPASSRDEELRLARAMGSPTALLDGERHRAARLLGVALEAPPAVVDAALDSPFEVKHARATQSEPIKKGSGKGKDETHPRPVVQEPETSNVDLEGDQKTLAKAEAGDEAAGKSVSPDDDFALPPETIPLTGPEKAQAGAKANPKQAAADAEAKKPKES